MYSMVTVYKCMTKHKAWKMPAPMYGAENFFDFDDDERKDRLARLSLPSIIGTGPRQSKGESAAARDGWKSVHMNYYAGFGFEWPPSIGFAHHICLDGIRAREAEVVFLADAVWEMEHDQEFLDVNPKVEMTLQGCFKENLETGEFELKKTPWKATPRTIVGSTKLILRYHGGPPIHEGGEVVDKVVRAATGTEYLRLIGWDDMQWVHPLDTSVEPPAAHEFNEICSNVAGNAWSPWHFLPLKMATVATIGRFGKTNAIDVEDEVSDVKGGAGNDDDASSSFTDSS